MKPDLCNNAIAYYRIYKVVNLQNQQKTIIVQLLKEIEKVTKANEEARATLDLIHEKRIRLEQKLNINEQYQNQNINIPKGYTFFQTTKTQASDECKINIRSFVTLRQDCVTKLPPAQHQHFLLQAR